MTRRFWVSAALAVPLLVVAMADMIPGRPFHALLAGRKVTWLQLALATPVVLWGGWPFFVRGWRSLVTRQPQHVHADRHRHRRRLRLQRRRHAVPRPLSRPPSACTGKWRVYFEAAAVIIALVLLGQVLELRARERTGGAIRALLGLAPADRSQGCAPTAARRTCRSPRCASATCCASVPARRSPSTASSSKGRARSTNRWSPASRCRSRRTSGDAVTGGTLNGTGSFVMRAERVGARHPARADRAAGGRGAAQPRADPAARRPGGGVLRPGRRGRCRS